MADSTGRMAHTWQVIFTKTKMALITRAIDNWSLDNVFLGKRLQVIEHVCARQQRCIYLYNAFTRWVWTICHGEAKESIRVMERAIDDLGNQLAQCTIQRDKCALRLAAMEEGSTTAVSKSHLPWENESRNKSKKDEFTQDIAHKTKQHGSHFGTTPNLHMCDALIRKLLSSWRQGMHNAKQNSLRRYSSCICSVVNASC